MPGIVVLDEDDHHQYENVRFPGNWERLVIPRTYISEKCNLVLKLYPNCDFYGITNDDVVPETPGWDVKLREAAGSRNFAYGDDGINHRYSTAIHGGDLVREVGWILCPSVRHFYTDDAWEIFGEVGLGIYLPDIKVSHFHFSTGKGEYDKTYRERGNPGDDQIRFEKWKQDEWPELKSRLSQWLLNEATFAVSQY